MYNLRQGDQRWLVRISHLVVRIPLALELAASWVQMLPLADIAQEIQQSLDFLETDLHVVNKTSGHPNRTEYVEELLMTVVQ